MSRILGKFDATTATRSSNAYTLPTKGALQLAISCATTGRTVQTSASTFAAGIGANSARAASLDGATFGLAVESQRKNESTAPQAVGSWTTTGAVTVNSNVVADPSGVGTTADEVVWANGAGKYDGTMVGLGQVLMTVSYWLKVSLLGGTGAGNKQHFTNFANDGNQTNFTVTSSWGRFSTTYTPTGATVQPGLYEDLAAAPDHLAKTYVGGYWSEQAKYPQSFFPTAASTRAADVLSVATPSVMMPGGFFDVEVLYRPAYAQNETAVDHTLYYVDVDNSLIFRQVDAKFVLKVNGTLVASSATTFARGASVTVRAVHSPLGLALKVSGAATGNGTSTGSAQAAARVPATCYLLGSSTGAEEASDLLTVTFRHPTAP